ncbi:hypothetical protein IGS75_01375 [Gluconobacter sphaericus]|uniref:hypothetical protein n=1 Tax=Gluconobacter sphaericus TaxID=574987 RepID=UPI001922C77E|nr:hypothetical protein [Gluconobacter sphaericus]QQX91321.1 hypothetical protein IGS75_01375 [Gluconobacter sphaericus]
MSDASRKAFLSAMDSALDWLEANGMTAAFANFTEAQAESFFASFLDKYVLEITATWDRKLIRTIGVPRNDQG